MSRLALSISPEWRPLFGGDEAEADVASRVPADHILGVRALARRKWRVWLMTDVLPTHKRTILWSIDITNTSGAEAALFALRKYAPTTTVTVDDEDYIRDVAS